MDVRLLRYDDVAARAYPAPAFSNGFEGDCWTGRWCQTCKARRYFGVPDCPIFDVMTLGEKTPRELEEVALGGLENRYACAGYEVREGEEDARDGLPREGSVPPTM